MKDRDTFLGKGDRAEERKMMVEKQLVPRGITDRKVLDGMLAVPRHLFVPDFLQADAYEDRPLPISQEQTISQPYIVAEMIQSLEISPAGRVLEVGTGSGYGAAVLSRIVSFVFTVERHRSLAQHAEQKFDCLKYTNIQVRVGDGTLGWPEKAPFDGIVVTAAAPAVPLQLIEQLATEGWLVIPVGNKKSQELLRIKRGVDGALVEENLGSVRFVPLIGSEGYES